MIRRPRHVVALATLTATVLAVSACSRTDEVVSTADDTATDDTATDDTATVDTTAEDTTIEAATTTVPETTTIETTTTVEATTTVPETTTTTTPPATSTTVPGPAPALPPLAYASVDVDLVEIDVATGGITRTLTQFFNGDGVFRGSLRLSPDATTLWFSEGYEDGWFGCQTSVGSFGRVDVASGAVEIVGTGSGVEPSPDGTRIAYITSDLCLPDPENTEFWVLTPYDRVVVRDLASGAEQVFTTSPAPADYAAPSQVTWTGFTPAGGLLVLTADGQLRQIDPAGSAVIQDHSVVLSEVLGLPVGTTGGALVTIDYGTEGSADLYATDLASGGVTRLATSDGFVTVGIAASGAIVVAGFTDVEVDPGAPVTVLVAPDGATFSDIDW